MTDTAQEGAAAYSFAQGPDISDRQRLMLLANGQRFSAVVYALAELGIADQLVDGPRTVADLAGAVGAQEAALYRLLRCAALLGVFEEVDGRRFRLTPIAEGLRTDLPDGVRDAVLLDGSAFFWSAFGSILHSVRTGRPGFDEANGMSFWEHLRRDQDAGQVFDDAMTTISRRLGALFLERYDFSRFGTLADIGGGRGYFLSEILRRNPDSQGILFDRPEVTSTAAELLDERGVTGRVKVVGGDFFADPLPTGADAYLLKTVLHDWPDDRAVEILRAVRDAIGDDGGRLLVLEQVVAPLNTWDTAKFLDVDMLVVMGGQERNLEEWRALLAAGGFTLENEPPAGDWAVLECTPR
ncbi:O-methyltransferase [Streptomyces sp. 3MP-14]|uniref:O-methyltransferase n=1 Tax=Streptomyces mimosae TaxID=2586635 RepID=A0A5N6AQK7_9ACTN|nr:MULTISPECIES: methyltransferase [Streptomyces]KAB8169918.1 O-methyltransferase [Streptomyces mimosae]KAB8178666.1 O-methyltransferase [Streptomyces sp. 3MP-14]